MEEIKGYCKDAQPQKYVKADFGILGFIQRIKIIYKNTPLPLLTYSRERDIIVSRSLYRHKSK